MRNILKSRRGIAIELAIFVIILTAAMSIIILTTAIHESRAAGEAREELLARITLSEIGEWALGAEDGAEKDGYTVTREDIGENESITVIKNEKTVLSIEIGGGEILKWD